MKILALTAQALISVSMGPRDAVAQEKSLQEQVVGTWAYVAVDIVRPDGSRVPLFGENPKGLAIFDNGGRYILMTTRTDQPKFGSTNRMDGTAEENKAVVQGSIAHFGRYVVNEADRSITFRIENSTFPNWNGTEQKRPVVVSGDELKWVTPASTGSGSAEVLLKRAR
ncbi:MAG: lipocalin-like domain-containing protein [Burkholderiaceae bacterium]